MSPTSYLTAPPRNDLVNVLLLFEYVKHKIAEICLYFFRAGEGR